MITRPFCREDRQSLLNLLSELPNFSQDEILVAMELLDIILDRPGQMDYEALVAELNGEVVGYICFGPTPMTTHTFDLYWVAVSPKFHRKGIARSLFFAMKESVATRCRIIRVETSSKESYGGVQDFYLKNGFYEECRIKDFYSDSDHLIIYIYRF